MPVRVTTADSQFVQFVLKTIDEEYLRPYYSVSGLNIIEYWFFRLERRDGLWWKVTRNKPRFVKVKWLGEKTYRGSAWGYAISKYLREVFRCEDRDEAYSLEGPYALIEVIDDIIGFKASDVINHVVVKIQVTRDGVYPGVTEIAVGQWRYRLYDAIAYNCKSLQGHLYICEIENVPPGIPGGISRISRLRIYDHVIDGVSDVIAYAPLGDDDDDDDNITARAAIVKIDDTATIRHPEHEIVKVGSGIWFLWHPEPRVPGSVD